ncbi:MAG: methyltransferase domain-containing protein [Thermoplasmatales archaeon]|nr:methyltransferase domain-containing protein [Thermoplasmatales archaeon]MCW6170310.1 methyltransferase domain-containing protein [Thermoplasmatales archaeon]
MLSRAITLIQNENESSLSLDVRGKLVRLAFVYEDDTIFVISTDSGARWPSHILRERSAALDLMGQKRKGVPYLIGDLTEKREVIQKFTNKYGDAYVSKYFSHPSRIIKIKLGIDGGLDKENYYEWLEEEFDTVADDYDEHIFGNIVNVLLRNRSLKVLRQYLPKNSSILEIGCGTGAETLELLKDGHSVLAVDISGRMLQNIKEKAKLEGLNDKLETRKMSASMIDILLREEGEQMFDLGYSTYGALNCEPHIEKMARPLSLLLKKDGHFVAGVYNKFCLSELMIQLSSMKFNQLSWRFRNPVPEGRSRFCIDVYSFTPSEFFRIFSDYFNVSEIIGVPVIFPPSNYKKLFPFIKNRYRQMNWLDEKLSGVWPTKFLGDHFLMVMGQKLLE